MPADLQASIRSVPAGALICLPSTVMVTSCGVSAINLLIQKTKSNIKTLFFRPLGTTLCERWFWNAALGLVRTGLAVQVIFKFLTPLLYDGHGRDSSRVAQRTEGASQHVLRKIINVVNVAFLAAAGVKARKSLLQPVCTFTAGDTPSTAFMLVELHDAERELDHACVFVANDNSARAEEASGL